MKYIDVYEFMNFLIVWNLVKLIKLLYGNAKLSKIIM
jgi:hypothetical protein